MDFPSMLFIKYAFNYAGESFPYRRLVICYLHFAFTYAEVAVGLPQGDLETLMELRSLSALFVNTSSTCQRLARRMAGRAVLLSALPQPWFYESVAHPVVTWVFQEFLVRPGCALSLG